MINIEKNNLRLYRAMKNNESNELMSKNQNERESRISFLNMIDIIYSHIIPSHELCNNGIIYSFTDNFSIAKEFLGTRGKGNYNRIGYIDISLEKNMLPIDITKSLLFLQPLWRVEDWIDLTIVREYEHMLSTGKCSPGHESVELYNYIKGYNSNIINTILPSRKGAFSLASNAREYAVICKNMKVKNIDDINKYEPPLLDFIIEEEIPRLHNWMRLKYVNNDDLRKCTTRVCNLLSNDLNNLEIDISKKSLIQEEIIKYDNWLRKLEFNRE